MHTTKPTCSLPAGLASAAAALLLLLCVFSSAPGAEAGPRCGSGLLCPDDGWFCCAPGREGCCKNIGTGGPFGRRLKTIELLQSGDPSLPPTVNVWQAGRLLHTTTSASAKRHLTQDPAPGEPPATTAQEGDKLSTRHSVARPGDSQEPPARPSVLQLRPSGASEGRASVPTRIIVEGFYTDRDQENRPGVGGDQRLTGWEKKGLPNLYERQQGLIDGGIGVADTELRFPGLQSDESGK